MSNTHITRRTALALISAAAASRLTACSGGATTSTTAPPIISPTPNTRPRFHLTPNTGFINDPQRPLRFNKAWNLWVLWNNDYPTSGGTAWKHYTTTDMVTWTDQGVSIPKYTTPQGDVWTGSTVIDTNNTAGYGAGAIIALVTQPCDNASGQNQSTCLWYSTDGGTTFTFGSVVMPNYPGNNGTFRDPSVFWHAPTQRWVLSLAQNGQIGIYISQNLKNWSYVSGVSNSTLGTMECPNLFALHLYNPDGSIAGDKWIMLCGANGYQTGRTIGTYYWVGSFDGTTFTADSQTGQWLDDGPDFYATTVFPNVTANDPLSDAYAIAWMNNWDYATKMQTTGYFGQLSVMRTLRLQLVNNVSVLFNAPIAALDSVFTSQVAGTDQAVSDSTPYKFPAWSNSPACRIDFTLGPDNGAWPRAVFLSVRGGSNYITQIVFDIGNNNVFLKRDTSGPAPTSDSIWNNNYSAPFTFTGPVDVSILVDAGSVEIFLNRGLKSITGLITAPNDATALNMTATGGSASISGLTIRSIE